MANRYSFGRIPDRTFIELVGRIFTEARDATAFFNVADNASVNISSDAPDLPDEVSALFTAGSYHIQTGNIHVPSAGFTVEYRRGSAWAYRPGGSWEWIDGNPFVDGFKLTGPGINPMANAARFLPIINATVDLAPPAALMDGASSAIEQSASVLSGLNAAVAAMVEHTTKQQKEYDDRRLELERASAERLAADREALIGEVDAKRDELEALMKDLATKQGELDDRANTHVRREIKTNMATLATGLLNERLFGRSLSTFWIPLILALCATGFLGGMTLRELSFGDSLGNRIADIITSESIAAANKAGLIANLQRELLYTQIRALVQGAGIAALVWFVLRLASSRFRQVSRWERDLQKFRLDTERAAFLVEGDLEAKRINSSGLPPVLLENFARGLFLSSDADGAAKGGAQAMGDTLATILGQSTKLEFGPEGVRAELNRRAVNKARGDVGDIDEAGR